MTQFTGIPKYQSTTQPRHGRPMIRDKRFPRLLWPASILSREVVGQAVRDRRLA